MVSVKLKFRASSVLEKEGRLYYQVICNRSVRQIMSDCFILPSEWNEREGQVIVPSGISEQRQRILRHVSEDLRWQQEKLMRVIRTLEQGGKEFSADDIVNTYAKECCGKTTVFDFFRRQINLLREAGRHSTANHYSQTLCSLMRYRDNCDLRFDAVTPQFTLAYETWLRG